MNNTNDVHSFGANGLNLLQIILRWLYHLITYLQQQISSNRSDIRNSLFDGAFDSLNYPIHPKVSSNSIIGSPVRATNTFRGSLDIESYSQVGETQQTPLASTEILHSTDDMTPPRFNKESANKNVQFGNQSINLTPEIMDQYKIWMQKMNDKSVS